MQFHLLHAARMPWPVDWKNIYGRSGPLLVEIGFGGGDFLVEWASQRPSANLLGLEISLPSLRKGERKIRQAGLKNVRVIQGNARLVLQALCQPSSIAEIFINFPDPWPKERHHDRRLINDPFLQLVATRLAPGGLLDIATDHVDYAQWIAQHLNRSPYFCSKHGTAAFVTEDNNRLQTKYEGIALEAGRKCYYFKWQRNEQPVENIFPTPKEFNMPHTILKTPLSLAEIGRRFQPMEIHSRETHIRLLEMFESFYDQKLFVELFVKEEPLSQRVGLTIRQREAGELIIGLHDVGFPRPTKGIQVAIGFLAQWLQSLHPETEIVKSNIPAVFLGA